MNDPCEPDKPAFRRSSGDDGASETAVELDDGRAFGFKPGPEASDESALKDAGPAVAEGAGDMLLADKMRWRRRGIPPERKPVEVGQRSSRTAADVVFTIPPILPAEKAPFGGPHPVVKNVAGAPVSDVIFMVVALVLFLAALVAPWLPSESEETPLADSTPQSWGSPLDANGRPNGGFSQPRDDERIEEQLAAIAPDDLIDEIERRANELEIETEPFAEEPGVERPEPTLGEGWQSTANVQIATSIDDADSSTAIRPKPALKPLVIAARQSTSPPVIVGTIIKPALKPSDFSLALVDEPDASPPAAEGFWQRFVQGVTTAFANRDTSYAMVLSAHASDRGNDGGRASGDRSGSGEVDRGGNGGSDRGGNGGGNRGGNGNGGGGNGGGGNSGGDRGGDDDDDDD